MDITQETDIKQQIIKLDYSNLNHTGPLILKFSNLKELDCSNSNLTYLDVSGCPKLAYLNANHNRLCRISVNSESLEYLNLLDNNFPEQDLTFFSGFVNLKELHIGNIDDREGDVYNRFHGSLEPLKGLTKLESLNINNTDIDSGLEYLPNSVKILQCLAERPNAKVKNLYMQLENFVTDAKDVYQGKYNLKVWKRNWNLETEKENLQKQITSYQSQMEELASDEKEYLTFQQEELENEKNDLLARQEELRLEKSRLEQEVRNLTQQVETLTVDLERMNAIYQEREKGINEMESKLKSFKSVQEMDKVRLLEQIKALKDDLTVKGKEKMNKVNEINKNNFKLKNKKEEIEELEGKLNEIKIKMVALNAKKEESNQLRKDLNNKVIGSKCSTAHLRKQLTSFKNDIDSKKMELSRQLEGMKKLKNNLNKAKKDLEKLQDEKDQIENEIESHREEEKRFQENLANLNTQLEDKEALINKLQEEKQQQVNELKGRLVTIKDLFPQIQTKENELKELIDTIKEDLSRKRKPLLEQLLEEQKKSIQNNGNSDSEEVENYKKDLNSELTEQDILKLLSKHEEVIQLKKQLEQKF
ncbi:7512_t:CDS:1 [Funneliformis caledonium]|uniref:7512_t:CDS:1 n=1 Tax=Funneliformis caledonium TaxID=1117310 RepID=A0A9N9BMW7_9GLOM|nr:7512_t:CDS:1 [Funneliformis caledonium]